MSLKIPMLLLGKPRRSSSTGQVTHSSSKLPDPVHMGKQQRKGKIRASGCLCSPHFHFSRAWKPSYNCVSILPSSSQVTLHSLCVISGEIWKPADLTKLLLWTVLVLLLLHSSVSTTSQGFVITGILLCKRDKSLQNVTQEELKTGYRFLHPHCFSGSKLHKCMPITL